MFCKWCGGALTPSDVKCSRCGKSVPPLSDCGGFYDLMPSAERYKEAIPVQKMETKQANSPAQKEPQNPKPKRRKANRGYICFILFGFAAIIALIIVLFSKVNQYSKVIDELKDVRAELDRVSEELSNKENNTIATENASPEGNFQTDPILPETTVPENTEQTPPSSTIEYTSDLPTESTTIGSNPIEPLDEEIRTALKECSIVLDIKLDAMEKVRRCEFGKLEGRLSAVCNSGEETDQTEKYICNFIAQQDQAQSERAFDFEISRETKSGKHQISIQFYYQGDVLGYYDSTEYTWEYRESNIGEWKTLPDKYCEISKPAPRFTQIDLDTESLLNKEHPEKTEIEIRCTAKRMNTSGGSLEVIIYGLTLSLDDFDNH